MDQKTLETLEYPLILEALANRCHFNPAAERALELNPLTDLDEVQALQAETAEAVRLFIGRREITPRQIV